MSLFLARVRIYGIRQKLFEHNFVQGIKSWRVSEEDKVMEIAISEQKMRSIVREEEIIGRRASKDIKRRTPLTLNMVGY